MSDSPKLTPPTGGEAIRVEAGKFCVPDHPIIPFIEGDGTGPDIWRASVRVMDAAVQKSYGGERSVAWMEIYAGEKSFDRTGSWLPDESVDAIREYKVAIKGPLTTPVGGGIRSINVALRQVLDLYACIRPVRWFTGVPAPVRAPEKLDVVIFRENTEDVYAGIEWAAGSPEAAKLRAFLLEGLGVRLRDDAGIGIKPISEFCTRRLVRRALLYAVENGRRSVTLVHKGNIQKFTEGAFRDWGYALIREEFADVAVFESEWAGGPLPEGKVLVNDRIADNMFQQLLLRPDEFDVLATTNLNGDYLSDACAAQVGGLGMAPGANIGDGAGVFEATHGTAPKYAGKDAVNPSSLLLSGVLMLRFLGWSEPADAIESALAKTIQQGRVTYDLARQMEGSQKLKTSEFADALIVNL